MAYTPYSKRTERFKKADRARVKKYRIAHPDRIRKNNFARMARVYSISPEERTLLLLCVCEICGLNNTKKGVGIDHNHTTNNNRGVLCGRCNVGLGQFKDNPALLYEAKLYLERVANL